MTYQGKDFVAYEYKDITVNTNHLSLYLDSYENFGWEVDEKIPFERKSTETTLRLKRNRKIINKTELTRLQRNFESSIQEIRTLEKSKTTTATILALVIGLFGTAFIAGSVFAVSSEPPIIWLCIILAIPGFIGWVLPYLVYHQLVNKRVKKIQPFIEEKYEDIYRICEKGHSLH